MLVDLIQNGSVAAAAVLHPVTYAGYGAAAQFGFFDDIDIFGSGLEHFGRLQTGTDFYKFFFGHDIA